MGLPSVPPRSPVVAGCAAPMEESPIPGRLLDELLAVVAELKRLAADNPEKSYIAEAARDIDAAITKLDRPAKPAM
jgi:hypothetical protein